jgi:manganese/zinc/iron transport system substrate-binding protein
MISDRARARGDIARMAIFFVVAASSMSCGGAPDPQSGERLRIVATTTVVGDLVGAIAGPDAELEVLMGPGIDPHLYKASAGDVGRMSSAQIIFYNGLHLEGKMAEVLEGIDRRGVRTVAVAECLPTDRLLPLEGFTGLYDPHVWFDVVLWSETVDCVAAELAALDPPHAEGYRARAAALLQELAALDDEVRRKVSVLPEERRVLVTAHDAFSYFGRAYGFEVRGLLGVSTAAEAGTADVQSLAGFIVERRIPAIFVETSVPPRFVQALQEAVAARGFEVAVGGELNSDSLGDPGTPAATYSGTVRGNAETIVSALAARGGRGQES